MVEWRSSRIARPLLLAAVVLAFLLALAGGSAAMLAAPQQSARQISDQLLYRAVAADVARGASYYDSAIARQRAWNYPVRPFVTVRMPVLAWVQARLGDAGLRILAGIAALALFPLWMHRLKGRAFTLRLAAIMALVATALPLVFSPFIYFHDYWAGLLLAFAIALHPARWRAGVATLAALIRELTAPFLAIEAAVTLMRSRRPILAAPALGGLIVIAGILALHAWAVWSRTSPADLASAGWSGLRGPAGVVGDIAGLTVLQFLPFPLAAALVFLPLLGWCEFDDGGTALCWFGFFLCAIALLARADNSYWAANVLPAYFAGLAFVPAFFRNLGANRSASARASSTQPAR